MDLYETDTKRKYDIYVKCARVLVSRNEIIECHYREIGRLNFNNVLNVISNGFVVVLIKT